MELATSSTSCDFDPAISYARQTLYRFVALAFLDPRHGSWETLRSLADDPLVDDAARLIRQHPASHAMGLGPGEWPLSALEPDAVFDRLPATAAELNDRFEGTFGLLVSSACPPYETEYVSAKHAFQRAQGLADISGFYRAFGLRPATILKEREDHIVLMLEFMATLIALERRATEDADPNSQERVSICRDAQKRFLGGHLAWWAPAFCRLLSKQDPDGFYGAAGVFLAAFLPSERGMLAIPIALKQAAPSPLERPEECDHCSLAT